MSFSFTKIQFKGTILIEGRYIISRKIRQTVQYGVLTNVITSIKKVCGFELI